MQHAVTFPLFRSVAVGGLLLALTVAQVRAAHHPHVRRLVLHTTYEPGAVYLSAWRNGDVRMPLEGDALVPLTATTRATVSDGCRWLATEKLVPIGPKRYAYRYDETILSCEPGARPARKTPRTGCVTVED
jgi:hypothetical protein